jgi:WhiB family transcriptional regulator, redox-sensing transcriptional regulator
MVAARRHWRSAAACRVADPDLFFPVSSSGPALEQVAEAKEVCARCQVRPECLAFALRTHQVHGVWGGMSEQERYLLWSRDERRIDGAQVIETHVACGPRQLAGSDAIGRSHRCGAAVYAGALPAETAPRLRPRTITPVSAPRRGPAQRD